MSSAADRHKWTSLLKKKNRQQRRTHSEAKNRSALRVTELEDRVTPALLSYYPAEGNANDFNLLNNGSLQNGATFAAGKFGQAFSLDGANDHVLTSRQIANDFTIAAWIKTSTATSGGSNFFEGHPVVTAEVGGVTNDFGTTIINERFAFGVGNPDQTIQSTTDVVDGMWHHVAAVRQGNKISVYVDGKLENSLNAANGGPLTTSAKLVIGGDLVNNRYFPGLIDDVRIDNAALSDAEIATLAGQTVIAEDFAGGVLPAFLEQKGPSVTFAAGQAQFNGGSDANRTNLRTIEGSYFGRDFVAEVDVTTNNNISFFGFGTAVPATEPTDPSIHSRFHSPSIQTGRIDIYDTGSGAQTFANIPSTGPHRLRFVWDATAQTGQLFVDANYVGGAFVTDFSSAMVNGADNGFTATNAHVFFGASDGVTFDNLQIRSSPPVIVGTLSATLVGTTLTVTDTDATGLDNTLTAVVSGTNLVITDATEAFTGAPTGGTLSNGNKTLTIPLASVTALVLNTMGGSDFLTADFTGGNLPTTTFNGGTGITDKLAITGGSTTTQTFNFTNENDGSVVLAGAIAGTVNYTGLEPVTSTINATNVVLNYSGASETITVTASGAQTSVDSTAGEIVTFNNPTGLLEINSGDGTDTINVNSFGTGFGAALDIDGEAGTGDTVNLNAAVTFAAGKNLTVAAETINVAAAQVLSGTGAINLTAGQNILVSANLTGGTGGTTISANGTAALNTIGVKVQSGAVVTATGAGAVSVTGTGSAGASSNFGVQVTGTGSKISSGGGNVSVTGTGNGASSTGVYVFSGSQITSGGTGTVTVQGTSNTSNGVGVLLDAASSISSGGSGKVSVTGIATGSGRGVWVFVNSQITSGGGDVTVNGTSGPGATNDNMGVLVENVNAGQPGITSGGNGNVTIIGQGGGSGASANNNGVWLRLDNAIVSAGGSGTLTIQGTGGTGSGGLNHGVRIDGVGSKMTTGGGNVSVTGVGGTGGTGGSGIGNLGVYLTSSNTIMSGGSGSVTVLGTGGTSNGDNNFGLYIVNSGQITSSGGNVQVTGIGGSGSGLGNVGVYIRENSTKISSGGAGTVGVTGIGGGGSGSGNFNHGVFVLNAAQITSGGTGNVTVTGTGGTGNGISNFGVWVLESNSKITSGGGQIFVSATGNSKTNPAVALAVQNNGSITSGSNASIFITADSVDLLSGTSINSGTGTTTLQPRTAGTKVDLGGGDVLAGSPLTLGLTDAELDRVTAGTIQVGNASTGNINVSSPITISTNLNLTAAGGKTATLGSSINAGTGNVTFTGATGAVSVVSNSTWLQSTVIDGPTGNGTWTPTRFTPPAVATFTIPVSIGNQAGIDGTDVADIGGGAQPIRSFAGTYFYRTTFTLPTATGITANIRLSVDNDAQVFINGQEVAREVTLTVDNFNGPNYPQFRINPDGSIDNVVQFDTTFNFTNWIAGTNELVVAVRNTDGGDSGGLVFRMDITVDQAITIVPSGTGVDVTANKTSLGTNNTLGIAINGTTVDTQYQQLNVAGGIDITGSKLLLSGSHIPVSGNSFVIVNNDGVDPVVGTFAGLAEGAKVSFAGGDLYITYMGGDGNDVVLNFDPVVNGTAGGDTLVVTPTVTGYNYQLNANPVVSVVGTAPLTFNGLDGDDTMIVNLNAFNIPTIIYDGGNQDTPATAGANAVFGDVLVVRDTAGHTATYTSAATLPVNGFAGTVAVLGEATISFTGLEPVDLIGLAIVNVNFANGNEVISIANGKDSGTNSLDAIVVSGTSGGVGFEQVHLRNNALVNINTVTGGSDGNDTMTIASADNAHGNANLSINTGAGADSVNVTGGANFSNTISINTVDLTTSAGLLAGTDITIDLTGNLLANGNIQVTTGNIDIDADGSVTANGTVLTVNTGSGTITVDAGTTLSVGAAGQLAGYTSVTTTSGGNTTFDGQVISSGPISITSGGKLSTSAQIFSDFGLGGTITTSSVGDTTFLGAVQIDGTGSIDVTTKSGGDLFISNTLSTNGGNVTGTVSGTASVTASGTVSASGSVNFASQKSLLILGSVTAGTTATFSFGLDDAGRSATVTAPINGTSASITSDGGVDNFTVSASGTAPLTLDGGALGDTYTVNVGTLNATVSVVDSGVGGTDTLNVNGTAVGDTFEVNTATSGDATVQVNGNQVVTYTKTIEVMNLDGAVGDDTFNIWFAQGGTSFLPALVNIVETGVTAGDVANISGTDNADVIDANYTADRTTNLGSESVTYGNGKLDTLNVFSKAGNDVVYTRAVPLAGGGPVVNLNGGSPSNPTPLPGDILIVDVTGQTGVSTANIKTPDGSVTSTSHNLLTWVDFETIPTPIGLGGSFEFGTATSPVQAGPYVVPPPASYWIGVNGANTYPTKGYYGWNTPVNSYDRGNNSPNPAKTTFQNLLRDGNWFGPVNVSRTFSVAAIAAGDYQVSITIGDTAVVMDNVYVTIEGSAQQLVPTVFQNQFITIAGVGQDVNNDGKLDISFVDKGGTHSYWHVNALDVRPLSLVSPVTITRADGMTTALVADGLTKTTYFAHGFFPNSVVTVATTNGAITTADVDAFLVGVQVLADGTGKATFELLHPTGNSDVTITANAAVIVDAIGSFTQSFTLTPSQKIDFNTLTTPTETGYLGFTKTLYGGSATNGLGWLQPVQLGDRGAAHGNLFRDFAFNSIGTAARGEFNIDLPTGDQQVITVYLGDPITSRDRLQVEVFNGTSYDIAATEIATTRTTSVSFTATPVDIGGGNFQVRLRFSDLGGPQNGWSVQGIEYRRLVDQGVLGITPTAAVAGDGTTIMSYSVSGGAVGGLITITSAFGAIQGTDASSFYDGFQILLDGSGNGTFALKSPVVAFGTLDSAVGLVSVNGSHAGGFTQQYIGSKTSFDFGPLAAPVAGGFKGLSGSTKFNALAGFGFKTAVGDFDRNPASFPNVGATATPDLFRDGAWGSGTGAFRILVEAGATNVPIRVYAYDAYSTRGNLTVTAEGGAKQTLPTSLTVPAVFDVLGSDTNNDGILDFEISGFSTWVMNGVEVG